MMNSVAVSSGAEAVEEDDEFISRGGTAAMTTISSYVTHTTFLAGSIFPTCLLSTTSLHPQDVT